jgi:competence protein ComEA
MMEKWHSHRLYAFMFVLNLAVLMGVIYLLRRPEPRVIKISTPGPLPSPVNQQIQVQVSGEITQPGVYSLTLGSRVSDALEAAGGPLPAADLAALDLARKLRGGDVIVAPTRAAGSKSGHPLTGTRPAPAPAPGTTPPKININTASLEELDALPRIGTVLAQRIVDYREKQGPFKRIEDIKNVEGIGDVLFENMREMITVE